ncbi:MAG: prepilin-type N-terminal cleavage/methylation domain-containing protein [Patescibacteria group bacterium]|jgi:prepilin-type N-terminal cleavage/methylation domain-containing protein|nr:prepilin-type N-terminal cleavage/methylation domain-containing protein [Patescibacteria group bacterium]
MIKNIIKNERGYSLLEMIVAIAIFAVVFLMITSIYLSMIESQKSVIATQNIQESMKFVFEMVSKEIRTAVKSEDSCAATLGLTADIIAPATVPNKIFNIDSTTFPGYHVLYFMNRKEECVSYAIGNNGDVDSWTIRRVKGLDDEEMFVTPNEISLENLYFNVWDDEIGAFHSRQPSVTLKVDVETSKGREIHKQKTTLQTTITSRYYE